MDMSKTGSVCPYPYDKGGTDPSVQNELLKYNLLIHGEDKGKKTVLEG